MNKNLKLTESISVDAPAADVWRAVTDPATIEKFMWGTHAVSEWRPGSDITFEGVYQGKSYRDQGKILEVQPDRLLKYSFLSGTLPDDPENYSIITYAISSGEGKTLLTVTQEGALDQQALEHSKEGWKAMLGALKEILERKESRPS